MSGKTDKSLDPKPHQQDPDYPDATDAKSSGSRDVRRDASLGALGSSKVPYVGVLGVLTKPAGPCEGVRRLLRSRPFKAL